MSLAQARADYRRKLAAHKAAKKAVSEKNYNNKMYKPRTFTVTCRYCKEEGHKVGHFDKELGRFVTTCVKAIEASQRKADWNKRKRQKTSNWKNQVSQAVAKETGSSGWSTAGSKNKVSAAQKTEKPVLKFAKNRFSLDEDSDEETTEIPSTPASRPPPALAGVWKAGAPKLTVDIPSKPVLTRAPRKTTTPVSSDSSNNGSSFAPESRHSQVPEFWGDVEEDNSAW